METARRWFNDCLAQRKAAHELVGWSVSHTYQLRQVKTRKAESPFAAGVHSHVLQRVCTDLERAFQAFFRRVKEAASRGVAQALPSATDPWVWGNNWFGESGNGS